MYACTYTYLRRPIINSFQYSILTKSEQRTSYLSAFLLFLTVPKAHRVIFGQSLIDNAIVLKI